MKKLLLFAAMTFCFQFSFADDNPPSVTTAPPITDTALDLFYGTGSDTNVAPAASSAPKAKDCATDPSAQIVNGVLTCGQGYIEPEKNISGSNNKVDGGGQICTYALDGSQSCVDAPKTSPVDDAAAKKAAQSDATDPCNQAVQDTASMCTASNAAAIAQQTAAMASIAGASTANAGAACAMQSKIAAAQALFSGGVSTTCFVKISNCKDTCAPENAPSTAYTQIYAANLNRCSGYTVNAAASAAQGLTQVLASKLAGDCAKAYSASVVPTPVALVQSCSGDPAYAATHTLECYCISNPGDAKCTNAALALTPGGITGTLSSNGLKAGTGDPNSGGGLGNSALPTPGPSTAGAAAAAPAAGGGGFGGGGPAGAAVAAAPEDAGAAGAASGSGNIFGGFSAGQGGFSYGHAAGSSGGGGIAGAVKSLATKFNLGGLLPKRNDYINRSVAGMSVSAKDGVTGPNGPSIWEKVSRRYQIKKGELLPP